jgi:hypothetical protein
MCTITSSCTGRQAWIQICVQVVSLHCCDRKLSEQGFF